ncbi:MAG: GDSL-type esterase/lipase family protein [Bacteroidota bacterium]
MRHQLILVFLFLGACTLVAQTVYPLYDGPPPGTEDWDWEEGISTDNPVQQKFVYNVTQPTLTAYLPPAAKASGTGVVIAPGGGFHFLSIENEGSKVAEWLNKQGIAAFVLKYRLVKSETDNPFVEVSTKKNALADMATVFPHVTADGQAAIAYLRKNAEQFNLKTDQIGIMGFSAGGDVTMRTAFTGTGDSQPNFVAPIYPAMIGMADATVPKAKMPLFVAVAADDQLQLLPASTKLFEKWNAAGQAAELHVYERGGHGFGMLQQNLSSDQWPNHLLSWLKMNGYANDLNQQKSTERRKQEKLKRMETDYAQLSRYRAANAALPTSKPEDKRVVLLGNSITEGWARQDPDFFADNHFVGRGISGQTSPQLLLRFRQDVLDLDPFAVVLHIGTNDVAENTGPYDPDHTMSNIQSMVEIAQHNGVKVILAAVLPATKFGWRPSLGDRSQMIVELNRKLAALATAKSIPFVDYHTALTNGVGGMNEDIAADGVHPTSMGYEMMKEELLPVIGQVRGE